MMNRTLHRLLACITSAVLVSTAACSGADGATGPAGPTGAAGAQGAPGPQGPQGNANAWVYDFGPHNFRTNAGWQVEITGLTEAEASESLWQVYLVVNGGVMFHIPGQGPGNSKYSVMHGWVGTNLPGVDEAHLLVYVQLLAGFSGDDVAGVRVVRVAANPVTP